LAQFKPQKSLTFAVEGKCIKNDGLCDTLWRRQYACPVNSRCHSGTDVPTNNANEPKRPPLDAGDLSWPTPSPFVPGTIARCVIPLALDQRLTACCLLEKPTAVFPVNGRVFGMATKS
jgi:hypothetical protein